VEILNIICVLLLWFNSAWAKASTITKLVYISVLFQI